METFSKLTLASVSVLSLELRSVFFAFCVAMSVVERKEAACDDPEYADDFHDRR